MPVMSMVGWWRMSSLRELNRESARADLTRSYPVISQPWCPSGKG